MRRKERKEGKNGCPIELFMDQKISSVEGMTPNITIIVRNDGNTLSLTCPELSNLYVQSHSFSEAIFTIVKKVQSMVQDPFGDGWIENPPDLEIPLKKLPAILTIRFTWSSIYWNYSVKIDELPKFQLSGEIETLSQALYICVEHLYYSL